MKAKPWILLALGMCYALLLSGCTTELWQKERFARCHWSANPPNLRLFYSDAGADMLAEYDERSQGSATLQRRAYWLEPNARAIAKDRQPRFVSSTNSDGLVAVPVTDNPTNLSISAYQGIYALVSTNGQSFSLFSGQRRLSSYWLPVYFTGSGQRVKQVLLTPLAVVADATMISGAVALVGGTLFVIGECGADRAADARH